VARDERPLWVAFSLVGARVDDLRRIARRLAYPNLEPLAVEIFLIGLRELETRFETVTATPAGKPKAARVDAGRDRAARSGRQSARGTSVHPDRERRRDRVSRCR
jgi:hypothetical protein